MATQTRFPTSNHATSNWTSSTGGNKWEDVDEAVGSPDDDTTYIYRQASDGSQVFNYTAFAITPTAINKVTVTSVTRRTSVGVNQVRNILFTGTTARLGTAQDLSDSYVIYATDWLTNPQTGAAWEENEIEQTDATTTHRLTQLGVNGTGIGATEEVRCTQLYMTVDYTEVGGATAGPWLYYARMRS